MARGAAAARIADISARQWGLVTSRQAALAGVTRNDLNRLVGDGLLDQVAWGVYYLRGGALPEHLELRAAWLQLAPGLDLEARSEADGVVSHSSAAVAHGVGDFRGHRHHFTLPARRQTRRADVTLHQAVIDASDVTWLDGLAVTTVSRTVADLLSRSTDGSHVGQVIYDALQAGLAEETELAEAAAPHAPRYGFTSGEKIELIRYLQEVAGLTPVTARKAG